MRLVSSWERRECRCFEVRVRAKREGVGRASPIR